MDAAGFVEKYRCYGQDWMRDHSEPFRGKSGTDAALTALTEYLQIRSKTLLQEIARDLMGSSSVAKRVVLTGVAGLVPFGKLFVGTISTQTFISKVVHEFALDAQCELETEYMKQAAIDTLKLSVEKVSEEIMSGPTEVIISMSEAAEEMMSGAVEEVMTGTTEVIISGVAEESVHWLPIIGHAYSVGSGGWRAFQACSKVVESCEKKAGTVHAEKLIPLCLAKKGADGKSLLDQVHELELLQARVDTAEAKADGLDDCRRQLQDVQNQLNRLQSQSLSYENQVQELRRTLIFKDGELHNLEKLRRERDDATREIQCLRYAVSTKDTQIEALQKVSSPLSNPGIRTAYSFDFLRAGVIGVVFYLSLRLFQALFQMLLWIDGSTSG